MKSHEDEAVWGQDPTRTRGTEGGYGAWSGPGPAAKKAPGTGQDLLWGLVRAQGGAIKKKKQKQPTRARAQPQQKPSNTTRKPQTKQYDGRLKTTSPEP